MVSRPKSTASVNDCNELVSASARVAELIPVWLRCLYGNGSRNKN